MAHSYFSADECRAELDRLLGTEAGGPRGVLAGEVAAALVQDMTRSARAQQSDDLEVKLGSWAIRDDEIDLLGLLKDGVVLYLDAKPGAWVGLAVTLARQLLALWRKGVRLNAAQVRVLTELRRQRGPRELAELTAALDLEEPALRAELEGLAGAPSRAGPVTLAEKLADGRWMAHA